MNLESNFSSENFILFIITEMMNKFDIILSDLLNKKISRTKNRKLCDFFCVVFDLFLRKKKILNYNLLSILTENRVYL